MNTKNINHDYKNTNFKQHKANMKDSIANKKFATNEYGYYSKILEKPFDSLTELREAEAVHFAQLQKKEEKTAQKRAEALRVEESFKALNTARKVFKAELEELTSTYRDDLTKLKAAFEEDRAKIYAALSSAEQDYDTALKAFIEKYPEGYHLTLKDGDFETTISGGSSSDKDYSLSDIFSILFGF